ncbi:hypothetical protein CCP1ISM_50047 [Azospirillaceae bacterium]
MFKTQLEKARDLSQGETLTRQDIRDEEEKIVECLKVIKANCSKVINQIKNR